MSLEALMGNVWMESLGLPVRDRRTAEEYYARGITAQSAERIGQRLRALTEQYNVKINTPIQHCSECPHCKKIKREETLKAIDIAQHLLDKKAKYEKRCKDWVEKIRKLAEVKK